MRHRARKPWQVTAWKDASFVPENPRDMHYALFTWRPPWMFFLGVPLLLLGGVGIWYSDPHSSLLAMLALFSIPAAVFLFIGMSRQKRLNALDAEARILTSRREEFVTAIVEARKRGQDFTSLLRSQGITDDRFIMYLKRLADRVR